MGKKFDRIVHKGQLKEGKLVLDNPRWFRGMLALNEDCKVTVTVERQRNSKSQEQLGYLWGVVYLEISKHTGHTPEELHEIMKARHLRRKHLWRGSQITTVGSLGDLTTNEAAEFLSSVILDAGEMGIEVPPPDKLYQFR